MGFFEIFGRLVIGAMVTVFVLFILLIVGDNAGEKVWWKAIGFGFWIWMMILGVTLGIYTTYAQIFGPFVQAIF